jgi:hypothetical protein
MENTFSFTAVVLEDGAFNSWEVESCNHRHKDIEHAKKCSRRLYNKHSIGSGSSKRTYVKISGNCTCGDYSENLSTIFSDYLCEDCWEEILKNAEPVT